MLDEVFPFGAIQVLSKSEKIKGVNVCGSQDVVEPVNLCICTRRSGGVLDPGSKKCQFGQAIHRHPAYVAKPAHSLAHDLSADGGPQGSIVKLHGGDVMFLHGKSIETECAL